MSQSQWIADTLRGAAKKLANREYESSHADCVAVLKVKPDSAEAYYLLGILTADHENHTKACELFARAVELEASIGRYHADHARSLIALNQRGDAIREAETAEACPNLVARTHDTIGVVFSRAGLHERAVPHYAKATTMAGDVESYWYNYATGLQFVGKMTDAQNAYRRVLELAPKNTKAWSSLIQMVPQTHDDNSLVELETLFGELTDPDDRLHIGHALAKSYEDLKQPAPAMHWLEKAKAGKRATAGYDQAESEKLFAAAVSTLRGVDTSRTQSASGQLSNAPIFVVGLPRTGTTLIDRILSSHSEVSSAGELTDFALALKLATKTASRYVLDAETLDASLDVDLASVGADYLQRARRTVGDAPHFIDKMPLNVFYAALIHQALPNARIICVRRHPADSVLSNYRQLFATGFSYYNYSFELASAADYYVRFDRLTQALREGLPADRYTEVRYEDVVADLEHEARRLVAFCDLSWEDKCLAFHQNAAPVATASSSQVRRPLYSSSVGRWKRYREYIQPALDVLESGSVSLDD